jgi:hypothetical protein
VGVSVAIRRVKSYHFHADRFESGHMNTKHSAGATMKPLSESATANRDHAEWLPIMELATREVFEMMLGCRLAVPELGSDGFYDTTSIVGLAGKLCGTLTVYCGAK